MVVALRFEDMNKQITDNLPIKGHLQRRIFALPHSMAIHAYLQIFSYGQWLKWIRILPVWWGERPHRIADHWAHFWNEDNKFVVEHRLALFFNTFMSHFGLPTTLHPAPSTVKKAKKRVPRPSNCFIAYRMAAHRSILLQHPNINSKEVSQIVGKMWKNEPESIKDHFRAIANQMKEEHASRYPDYSYNPKRRTSDPVIMNGERNNESICEETIGPIRNHSTRRPTRQTTSRYFQNSSLASPQATSSQATSDYDYQEEINIGSQCAFIDSSSAGDDIWQKFENETYPGDDYFAAANANGCAMDFEDGTLTFSTSSSASNSSSQVNPQEYHPVYEPAMDCEMYVDTASVHPLSTKWWHEPESSPVSGTIEALNSRGLQYISPLDNFDYSSF